VYKRAAPSAPRPTRRTPPTSPACPTRAPGRPELDRVLGRHDRAPKWTVPGNYLNFLYGPTSGTDQKINIAHRIVNDFLTNVTGVRFGVMTFWYGNHNAFDKASGTRGAAMVAQWEQHHDDESPGQRHQRRL